MITFFEWVKKMAGGPYDSKANVTKSAGGWWGDPKPKVKKRHKRKRLARRRHPSKKIKSIK